MQCTSVITHGKWRLPDSFLKCEPVCLLSKPHTHKHMYVSSNYLVRLLIIPISLPPSFIRKEGDSGPAIVTLNPVSTLTDANLPTKTLQSCIKDYLAYFLILNCDFFFFFTNKLTPEHFPISVKTHMCFFLTSGNVLSMKNIYLI